MAECAKVNRINVAIVLFSCFAILLFFPYIFN